MKVYLTELQHKIFMMYVNEGMTQKEIAIKLYGSKHFQGHISKVLKAVSNKVGKPISQIFSKNGGRRVEVDLGDGLHF